MFWDNCTCWNSTVQSPYYHYVDCSYHKCFRFFWPKDMLWGACFIIKCNEETSCLNKYAYYISYKLKVVSLILWGEIFKLLKLPQIAQLYSIKQYVQEKRKNYHPFDRHKCRYQFLSWPTRMNRLAINVSSCFLLRVCSGNTLYWC